MVFVAVIQIVTDKKKTRQLATMDAFEVLQKEALTVLNHADLKDLREAKKGSDDYRTYGEALARIEHFCVGLNEKVYDKGIFYQIAHNYFDRGTLRDRMDILMDKKGKEHYENILRVLAWMKEYSGKSQNS